MTSVEEIAANRRDDQLKRSEEQSQRHEDQSQRHDDQLQREDTNITLTTAVNNLTSVVQGLQVMMSSEYPKRDEIEQTFVTKYNVKRRRIQLVLVGAVAIILAYLFSMGTVSYCFLQGNTLRLNSKPFCAILPGYADVVSYNKNRVDTYDAYFNQVIKNGIRLDKLENPAPR